MCIRDSLTADQLGIYSWAVTVFGILGIIVNFGLDFFLIRKIPEYRNSIVAMVGPVIKHVQKRSAINSIAIIVLLIPISYFSTNFFAVILSPIFFIVSASGPINL